MKTSKDRKGSGHKQGWYIIPVVLALLLWVALDSATNEPSAIELTGHEDAVASVAFSPDGTTLAAVIWDGTVRLWDTTTGENARTLTHAGDETRGPHSVAFSPDGTTLAAGVGDGAVRLWDTTTGETASSFDGHEDSVLSVAFSPDGTTLAAGVGDGTVRLWDITTGETTSSLD